MKVLNIKQAVLMVFAVVCSLGVAYLGLHVISASPLG
jgi:hypothetical protein